MSETTVLPEGAGLDPYLRSLPELQRAARQAQRLSGAGHQAFLWPVLFVPGLGGSRLCLLQAKTWEQTGDHDPGLWDPDDETLQRRLYGWMGDDAQASALQTQAWALELAARWQAPAQLMLAHEAAQIPRLMARHVGLSAGQSADLGAGRASPLLPALEQQLQQAYARLQARGWTALPSSYWPLADQLSDRPGCWADPQFAFQAHAHAWDWREHPCQAAQGLARKIQALLSQAHLHQLASCDAKGQARRWQWPQRPGVVIVAENAGVELVKAALPLCAPGTVLAVYAVDEVRGQGVGGEDGSPAWFAALCDTDSPTASVPHVGAPGLLSVGWHLWQAAFQAQRGPRLAVNALLPGPLSLLPQGPARHWLEGAEFADASSAWALLRSGAAWRQGTASFCAHAAVPAANPPEQADWQAQAQAAAEQTCALNQALAQGFAALPAVPPWFSCHSEAAELPAVQLSVQRGPLIHSEAERQDEGMQAWRLQRHAKPVDSVTGDAADDVDARADSPLPNPAPAGSGRQLSARILQHLSQTLLREAPTPFGQALRPAVDDSTLNFAGTQP